MLKVIAVISIICMFLILVIPSLALELGYSLPWWTVDGGGGESMGGSYELSATIGQADAGTLQGGSYTLAGGFWSAAPSEPIVIKHIIMLPLVKK